MHVIKGGGSYKVMNISERNPVKNGYCSSTREQKRAFKRQLQAEIKRKRLYEERVINELDEIRNNFYSSIKNFILGIFIR